TLNLPSTLPIPDAPHTPLHSLSLHDALPIFIRSKINCRATAPNPSSSARHLRPRTPRRQRSTPRRSTRRRRRGIDRPAPQAACEDRKSTRLNSSHVSISYAVFCLKKKKKTTP